MEAISDDGVTHIPGSSLADTATLCGCGIHGEFTSVEIASFRGVTCNACLDVVRIALEFSGEVVVSLVNRKTKGM